MRRIYFNLFPIALLLLAIGSCKKDVLKAGEGTATLTIFNGVWGNDRLLTNFNGTGFTGIKFHRQLNSVYYGNGLFRTSYSGEQELGLYRPADTLQGGKPLFNLTLNLPLNTMHTLYLMGAPQSLDTLFITNSYPYHLPADSTMGIRFVNISEGGNPVSVNLVGEPNGSAAANLPYKSVTAFKNYSAHSTVDSYAFEFRDKVTGEVVANCNLEGINSAHGSLGNNMWLNKDFTLILFGATGNKRANMLIERTQFQGQ